MSSTTVLNHASTLVLVKRRNQRAPTAATFSKNLKFLMGRKKYSQHEVARRSGVSQGAIGKILRNESVPTLEIAEKLSKSFGLSLWHMLIPGLPEDLIDAANIGDLFDSYMVADGDGREYIERTAQREASRAHQESGGK